GGELLADCGSAGGRGRGAGSDRVGEFVCLEDREKGKRDLWADAVDGDECLEEALLLDIGETVERHRVLAHDETCVESDLGAVFGPRDHSGRGINEVAYAGHIDDQRVGVAAGNFAVNTGDHIGNEKWEMENGEGRTRFKAASPSLLLIADSRSLTV